MNKTILTWTIFTLSLVIPSNWGSRDYSSWIVSLALYSAFIGLIMVFNAMCINLMKVSTSTRRLITFLIITGSTFIWQAVFYSPTVSPFDGMAISMSLGLIGVPLIVILGGILLVLTSAICHAVSYHPANFRRLF